MRDLPIMGSPRVNEDGQPLKNADGDLLFHPWECGGNRHVLGGPDVRVCICGKARWNGSKWV